MLDQWETLVAVSTELYDRVSDDAKPAFFQLVHHPVQASANLYKMVISAGINNLRVRQARLSANALEEVVNDAFDFVRLSGILGLLVPHFSLPGL